MELLPTIEEDDETLVQPEESENEDESLKKVCPFSNDFKFNLEGGGGKDGGMFDWYIDDAIVMASKKNSIPVNSIDAKIYRAREMRKLKMERLKEEKGNDETSLADDDTSDSESEEEEDEIINTTTDKEERKKAFFSRAPVLSVNVAFTDMNLSRPLLKAVTLLGFTSPTSVQARTIPLALMGKDICACAATGTGKTAAFMLPILERLLYRPTRMRSTRVLILLPTRELAIQVHSVGKALAQNTKIDLCLAAGGLEGRSQEASLRKSPDIVIATPGRLVDHLHNTPSFSLQAIEILVLDEADRMLDEHFLDQMNEIIRLCPVSRQTLLFSATMTDEVEELARLSLHNPVRVFVDSNTDTADNLHQEFVRIRSNKEADREAIVSALCLRSFKDHCLVFVPTKKQAHRQRLILGLLGIKTSELHGSLTQLQRLEALKGFKEAEVDILIATDLAARGLDIENVRTVINYSMPPTVKQYIHRVGRTARAGKSGKSVTLVGEKGRKVLKEIVKGAKCPPKNRVIPAEVIEKYKSKISSLESEIRDILKQEEEEKQVRVAQMEVTKANNMIVHHDEIHSRPPRVWFQDNNNKGKGKKRKQFGDGSDKGGKKAKIEETEEEKAARREMEFQMREAKRANKHKKYPTLSEIGSGKKRGKGRSNPQPVINESLFARTQKKTLKKDKTRVVVKSKGNNFKSKKRYKRK
ncbi:PREDICTED: probable ATP-dependent RNA helicase DDX27 [Amphimedon queenslandica]|uniref:RNA helicase n=1 Tax=Amphimedon queenslandica TaxID=400682 RepID=A0A1X7VF82_AMPQE|nr:PREDICTED: probable ATP-dependent RNA helicase DDX27 [Amphimedon queenslandica]|eukprot:XP_011410512.2 PREDICTED: probable ATP-dependent RNA helicase DDX27 [Amphimedon queenslandica]